MKFTAASSIALLSALASATVSSVDLYAESSNDEVNGQGLSPKHEGAGINYIFLGDDAFTLSYDDQTQYLTEQEGQLTEYFTIQGNIPQVSIVGLDKVTFDGGYLTVNGSSDGFYAQKNIKEPYLISQFSYAVVYYKSDAPSDAIPIKIQAKEGAASSSAAPSAAPSESAPARAAYANGTVTDHETQTVFTTYCPEPTTLVVVTCSEEKCQPSSITVSTPGSVTYTGKPQTSAAPTSESAAPSSVSPAVTTASTGGADAKVVGGSLLFAAGVAGLLI